MATESQRFPRPRQPFRREALPANPLLRREVTPPKHKLSKKTQILHWIAGLSLAAGVGGVAAFIVHESLPPQVSDELCLEGVENNCWVHPAVPITFEDLSDPERPYSETASTFNSLHVILEITDQHGNKSYQVELLTKERGILTTVVPGEYLQFPTISP